METASPDGDPVPLTGFSDAQRQAAIERWRLLRPHLDDDVPLSQLATSCGVAERTLRRWRAAYQSGGLAALVRRPRADRGRARMPEPLRLLIEGLALRPPRRSIAVIHRQAASVATTRGWPVPGYSTVHEIVRNLDPALRTLALDGTKRYREVYELVHRREASKPNQIWQADHTELDLWVIDPKGRPARPWLTAIEDDHSRAIAGYAVNLEAPSALSTALAFRQAIWRKSEPAWHVCGIPEVFHLDHGSDFTSSHLEQVMADLRVRPMFSKKGQPHGHGKIERFMETMNEMCLAHLPGYAPKGSKDRAAQATLTLAELDTAIGRFIREVYNLRPHSETKVPPQARWEAGAFIPRMPDSLEQLDLLLCTVAKPREVHTDGIQFLALRYIDPVLADYVGEQVTIRYDPRDITEIRVYLRHPDGTGDTFLCRAICPHLSGETVSLKEITAARNARRKQLRGRLATRAIVVDTLLALHDEPLPAAYLASTGLRRWSTSNQGAPATTHDTDETPTPGDGPRLKRYW
ncbi:putative transposase [Nonomuraea thailandensis]|uniref:Transposase n=1 Tax=Nonomuraea thailandensis TaxID=1188745 RepID=A0A9X2JYR0_9ACTN|nr:Mu transposase C-terminal domain-containing protein [Nonomuraea thailandensis]MCP2353394.1 putative transposase [Nonomuraea thailandensis]